MEDYRKQFIEKHSLTEEECDSYNENDIEFDIETDIPEDAFEQWNAYKAKNGYISYIEWTGIKDCYVPKVERNEGMDELKEELEALKNSIESSFKKATIEYNKDINENIDYD